MKTTLRKIISFILKIESRLVLYKYKPKIIAITGSVGKTSTKDAIYAVISKNYYVRKSEKSYNSELGLPLTILGCTNAWNSPTGWSVNILKGLWLFLWPHKYPKWLVLEVGVGKPGDMRETASWLRTDVVVITAIGETPAHIEFFESRKHLIEEKTRNLIITYCWKEGSDILGSGENIFYGEGTGPEGIIFRADVGGTSLPVVVEGVFGRNHIYAGLAALALSYGYKWNIIEAVEALKDYDVPP